MILTDVQLMMLDRLSHTAHVKPLQTACAAQALHTASLRCLTSLLPWAPTAVAQQSSLWAHAAARRPASTSCTRPCSRTRRAHYAALLPPPHKPTCSILPVGLLTKPCPVCSGVVRMQDGRVLCTISIGLHEEPTI